MNKYLYILLLTCSLFGSKIMDDTLSKIKEFYPEIINVEHKIYKLTNDDKKSQNVVRQKYFRKELNVWKIQLSDSTYRFGILDNVMPLLEINSKYFGLIFFTAEFLIFLYKFIKTLIY